MSASAADLVRKAVRDHLVGPGRVPRYERVLVACSGGADSLALTMATAQATQRASTQVSVAVIDHQLQPNSADIAQAAAAQCRNRIGIKDVVVQAVTVGLSMAGPEAAARSARYAALEHVADQRDCSAILLGHTADDQAETVLLGLARGSGARSLAGMPVQRGRLLRPLLGIGRTVVRAAADEWGLHAWQDPHNSDPRYARVRVRERVLPVLERELGPGIAEALCRTAEQLREDADALDHQAEATDVSGCEGLPIASLSGLPPAVQSRVLRRWLVDCGSPASALAAVHLKAVRALVERWRGQGPIDVPGGRVTRSGDVLRWSA